MKIIDDYKELPFQLSEQDESIYVFHNPITDQFKIGISTQVEQRKAVIRSSSGIEITCILSGSFYCGTERCPVQIEKFLHIFFKDQRRIGEWFELSVADIAKIARLMYYCDAEINEAIPTSMRKEFDSILDQYFIDDESYDITSSVIDRLNSPIWPPL